MLSGIMVPLRSCQHWEPPILPYQGPQWKLGSPTPSPLHAFLRALSCPGTPPHTHTPQPPPMCASHLPMPFSDITSGAKGERRCKQLQPSAVQESSTLHAPDTIAPPFHTPLMELLDPCSDQRILLQEWAMLKSTPVF